MDSAKYIARAKEKIASKGLEAIFAIPCREREYDPLSGKRESEWEDVAVWAVMLGIRAEDIGNGLVERGDARLLVAGDAFASAPDSGASVKIKGEDWRVVQSEKVAPDGTAILWKLLVRRS